MRLSYLSAGECRSYHYVPALECFYLRLTPPSLLSTLELATYYGLIDTQSTEGLKVSFSTMYLLPTKRVLETSFLRKESDEHGLETDFVDVTLICDDESQTS